MLINVTMITSFCCPTFLRVIFVSDLQARIPPVAHTILTAQVSPLKIKEASDLRNSFSKSEVMTLVLEPYAYSLFCQGCLLTLCLFLKRKTMIANYVMIAN